MILSKVFKPAYKTRLTQSLLLLILIFLSALLSSCQSTRMIRPTKHFYVNDYAEVLSDATIINITREGERLFKDTDTYINGGTKIIINTILFTNETDLDQYDVQDLINRWASIMMVWV